MNDAEPCGCLGYTEVIELSKGALSYRQLNYWTASGLIRAHVHKQVKVPGTVGARKDSGARTRANRLPYTPGQGRHCGWDRADAVRAVWMAQVVMATSMLPAYAAQMYDQDGLRIETVAGPVVITATPPDVTDGSR